MKSTIIALLMLLLGLPAKAQLTGCQYTTGSLPLQKVRASAAGAQILGCVNASFDLISSSAVIASSTMPVTFASSVTINGAGGLFVKYGITAATMTTTAGANFATASGSVGIGTASPGEKLHVAGSAYIQPSGGYLVLDNSGRVLSNALKIESQSAEGMELGNSANKPLVFYNNATERMRINTGGNVGISSTTPISKLTIGDGTSITQVGQVISSYGGISFSTYALGVANYALTGNLNTDTRLGVGAGGTVGIYVANSAALSVDANKNVGIGTTAPGSALEVNGKAIAKIIQVNEGTALSSDVTAESPNPPISMVFNGLNDWGLVIIATAANANAGANIMQMKTRSTGNSGDGNTIVANGDIIGGTDFYASDGVNYEPVASIYATVDGTPGSNDTPGRLTFNTTADGAASVTERMRIDQAGLVTTRGPIVSVGSATVSGGGGLGVTYGITAATSAFGGATDIARIAYKGTSYTGSLMYLADSTEDTYIRGGKTTSDIYIADVGRSLTMGNATNGMTLRGPVVGSSSMTASAFYGYGGNLSGVVAVSTFSAIGARASVASAVNLANNVIQKMYFGDGSAPGYNNGSVWGGTGSSGTFTAQGSGVYSVHCSLAITAQPSNSVWEVWVSSNLTAANSYAYTAGYTSTVSAITMQTSNVGYVADATPLQCNVRIGGASGTISASPSSNMVVQRLY